MKLYNTLSRKKEVLLPLHKDWVGLYTCGPTVYHFAHIGNLRTYIFEDILERALKYSGMNVRRVMNITDVGHLTGDTDAGEDKMERAAAAEKKSPEEIAAFYTNTFFEDLAKLNVVRPDIVAPATAHIREQIALIEILFEKGYAYDTPTAVYFDVSKDKGYGKLSGQSLEEKTIGARDEVVLDEQKHNAADFALWFKLTGKFKNHLLHWPSPWGDGFPGWHVECSAISRHFLGQPFDIHAGGVDHIGTHHENEIAQSEAAYDTPLAKIWVHGEHLLLGEMKMAKSEGNFFTLADLEAKGYAPLIFRYLALGAHYRTKLNFTWESLDAARNGLERIYETVNAETRKDNGDIINAPDKTRFEKGFSEALNDDLNTPKALAVFLDMLHSGLSSTDKLALVKKFDAVLGLSLEIPLSYYPEEDEKIVKMVEEYGSLRDNQHFVQSDALRKEIEALGYSIRDTENGPYVVKKFF